MPPTPRPFQQEVIEYPRMLHKAEGAQLVVQNAEEKAAALKEGWKLLPVVDAPKADAPKSDPPKG